jgi:hypothetical protein
MREHRQQSRLHSRSRSFRGSHSDSNNLPRLQLACLAASHGLRRVEVCGEIESQQRHGSLGAKILLLLLRVHVRQFPDMMAAILGIN